MSVRATLSQFIRPNKEGWLLDHASRVFLYCQRQRPWHGRVNHFCCCCCCVCVRDLNVNDFIVHMISNQHTWRHYIYLLYFIDWQTTNIQSTTTSCIEADYWQSGHQCTISSVPHLQRIHIKWISEWAMREPPGSRPWLSFTIPPKNWKGIE